MSSESGNNWEVRRNYIPRDRAYVVGQQALLISRFKEPFVRSYDRNIHGGYGIMVYQVGCWSPLTIPPNPDTVRNNLSVSHSVADLLLLHDKAVKVPKGRAATFQLNVYEPGGVTRQHRDKTPVNTFALGLLGVAECTLQDPIEQTWHTFKIMPGDGVYFDNPPEEELRPLHQFINIGDSVRVSLVE